MAITDDFNRANSGTLGSNWTATQNQMKIASNQARPVTDAVYNFVRYTGSSWNNDHTSEATVAANSGALDMELTVRHQAGGDAYIMMVHSSVLRIYKFVGGSFTQLVDFGIAAVDGHTYRLEASGSSPTSLKAFNNGTQLGSTITDSTSGLQSGGAPGIGGSVGTAGWDNWTGTGEASALNDARVSQIATELISGAIITDPRVSQLATELISRIPPLNLMTGLVGHWPFNETGLDTTDALDQHGTNNLTALGGIGASAQDPINSTPARYIEDSQAMGFLHADNADLSIGAGTDFTFIVRCKFESNTAFQTHLLSKDDNTGSAAYDFRLYFQQTSGFKFRAFDTSNSPFTTPSLIGPTSVTPGQTYFIACCYNHASTANELRVRMGTNSTDMQNAPASMPNYIRDSASVTRFVIGGKTSSSGGIDESLDGAIGPVSFWKRALTDAEIDAWVGVNGNYAAFGGVSSESRISQLVTELISLTLSDPRVSQIATELISFVPPTDQRVSQLAIELISLTSSDPRVSQLTIELITAITGTRVSQVAIELISLVIADPIVSQVAIELISLVEQVPRVSQLAVELISLVVSAPRVSQLSVELISLAALHERVEFFIVAG